MITILQKDCQVTMSECLVREMNQANEILRGEKTNNDQLRQVTQDGLAY